MNLSQLKMFVEVVRRGSLSEAARRMNLTQPAVTRKMQRLEKEIGIDLFERGEGHQTSLTSGGRDFLAFAERTLQDYTALQERWRAIREDIKGPLKLAASTTPGEYIVPRLLATFANRYPNVEPSLAILDSEEVMVRVAAHEYDAGFTGKAASRPNLANVRIFEDEIVLAVPPQHRFAQALDGEIELADLENEALIVREEGSGTMQSVLRLLEEHNLSLPPYRTTMALGSTQAIVSSVAAGLGLGFVSSLAVDEANGRVKGVRLRNVPLRRDLFLVYEVGKDQNGPMLLREFLNFVKQGAEGPTLELDNEEEED
jgi:DNA-binding transcriptional LysR family regulator